MLSRHAFTRFWEVHAWAGVLAGLALHVMVLTGGITLFREQLAIWEEPTTQQPRAESSDRLGTILAQAFPSGAPEDVWVYLPTGSAGALRLDYTEPTTGASRSLWVDSRTGLLVPERERLSRFLYEVHFLWFPSAPWLYDLAGILALVLLLAIVTGVLIQLRNLVRQFHQFRPDRTRRVFWSDMHKVLGVMGLPFQAMYAYTGAYMVVLPYLVQAFSGPVFGGDVARAEQAAWGIVPASTPVAGELVAVQPLDALVTKARALRPDLVVERLRVHGHGREHGFVEVQGRSEGVPHRDGRVRLQESDGRVIEDSASSGRDVGEEARAWIYGLHFAHFGGLAIRFLFFALALATCATILTGNLIWLARRQARRASTGHHLLARLTIGVGAGSIVAVAALFLASRVLPLEWAGRMPAEELTFLVALFACVVWALVSTHERALWWQQLGLAGLICVAVPPLAATQSVAGLFGTGESQAPVLGVDLALLTLGVILVATAGKLRRGAHA